MMKKFSPFGKLLSSLFPFSNKLSLKFHCLFLTLFIGLSVQSFSQTRTITGRVTSQGTPVTGATVQVKGTTTATQTDNAGSFSLSAPSNGTLVISSVGYGNQEVTVNGRSAIDVNMVASTQQLTDVVVVGYGTQKKVPLPVQ
jgi:iron complex outermembrane receptor protein